MNYGWLVQSLGTVAYNDTVIEKRKRRCTKICIAVFLGIMVYF